MTFNIREPLGINTCRSISYRQKTGAEDRYWYSGAADFNPGGYNQTIDIDYNDGLVTVLECENGMIDFFAVYNYDAQAVTYTINFIIDGYSTTGSDSISADAYYNNYIMPQYYSSSYFTNGPYYFSTLKITLQVTSGSDDIRCNYRYTAESLTGAL